MCLAIPGKVQRWIDRDPLMSRAVVSFEGVASEVHMACVNDAKIGDYVMVHAGVAIGIVDADRAEATLADLRAAGEIRAAGKIWDEDQT
ncbi:MAG: HypC/HybG/HupF family hydrogenase formation chaperone [Planctomycetaceae bacterium]|jgi:hydrogenase expression/formation protein HypC|nr:HypC/HybG/HupF family hydrogenase formation chaperone [Planctomycetaceae bacterium]